MKLVYKTGKKTCVPRKRVVDMLVDEETVFQHGNSIILVSRDRQVILINFATRNSIQFMWDIDLTFGCSSIELIINLVS